MRAVVAPLIGIANLIPDASQLSQCLLLGFRTHPVEAADALAHGVLDTFHHVERALLEFGREDSGYIDLTERLAEVIVDPLHAALPARLHFGSAVQVFPIELEVLLNESRRKALGGSSDHMKAQIRFPVVDRFGRKKRVEFLDERGSVYVEDGEVGVLHVAVVGHPVEIGSKPGEVGNHHLVDQVVRIATFHPRERGLGHGRFHSHDRISVLFGHGRGVANQLENLLQVLQITFTRFLRLGVILDVVVAIGHTQAALIDVGDHLLGVVRVLRRAGGEQHGTVVGIPEISEVQPRHLGGEILRRLDLGNGVELRLNGRYATFFYGAFVHAGGVEVANLLGHGVALGSIWLIGLGCFFQHAAEEGEVVLIELAVDRP